MTECIIEEPNRTPRDGYGLIYCYTNIINGKQYIGQTTKSMRHRNGGHLRGKSMFDIQYKTHKGDYHLWVIGEYPIDLLDYKERLYIQMFGTMHPNGLNYIDGGCSNKTYSIASRKKLSDAQKRRCLEHPELLKNHGIKMKEYYKTHIASNAIKVMCLETGIVYDDCKKASFAMGGRNNLIPHVISGHGWTAFGFHWVDVGRFSSDLSNEYIIGLYDQCREYRAVLTRFKLKGRIPWCAGKHIQNKWNGKHHTSQSKIKMRESKIKNGLNKRVICCDTGKIYETLSDAQADTGCNKSSISKVCKGKIKTSLGMKWRYVDE